MLCNGPSIFAANGDRTEILLLVHLERGTLLGCTFRSPKIVRRVRRFPGLRAWSGEDAACIWAAKIQISIFWYHWYLMVIQWSDDYPMVILLSHPCSSHWSQWGYMALRRHTGYEIHRISGFPIKFTGCPRIPLSSDQPFYFNFLWTRIGKANDSHTIHHARFAEVLHTAAM